MKRTVIAAVAVALSTFALACSGGSDDASSQASADFAAFATCMKAAGCSDVPSCPQGSTSSTCVEEADSNGRLIALWYCPTTWPTSCVVPAGDRLSR